MAETEFGRQLRELGFQSSVDQQQPNAERIQEVHRASQHSALINSLDEEHTP